MKVYVLVHEIYNYDWGEYDTKIELFKSLNDLRDYAIILSETIIEEYLQYEEVETLNEIEERYEFTRSSETSRSELVYRKGKRERSNTNPLT